MFKDAVHEPIDAVASLVCKDTVVGQFPRTDQQCLVGEKCNVNLTHKSN